MITIFDDLPLPPAAALLGWELIDLDLLAGTIEVGFDATPQFLNPLGFVQGGFLSAMLDDTLGPVVFAQTKGQKITTTIDLNVHFVRPVSPGRITSKGRIINLGQTIAFMTGELFDSNGKLAARASASALLRPINKQATSNP